MAADKCHRGRLLRGAAARRRRLPYVRDRQQQARRGRDSQPHRFTHRGPHAHAHPHAVTGRRARESLHIHPEREGRPQGGHPARQAGVQGRQVPGHHQDQPRHDRPGPAQPRGDLHRQLLHLPRGEALLQQQPVPPAHHRRHLRAAVRRPHWDGQRRPRVQVRQREPDRGQVHPGHGGHGQRGPRHQREPVLPRISRFANAAGELHALRRNRQWTGNHPECGQRRHRQQQRQR